MKIVFFSPNFYPLVGGLESVMQNWATGLVERGHRVQVITLTRNSEPDRFLFEVFRQISQLEMWRLMRKADVIVQFNVSLKGILPCLLSLKPLIISHHSTNHDRNGNWVRFGKLKDFIANNFAKKNIACSAFVARKLRNAVVVRNPFDSSLFEGEKKIERNQDVIFVGRLVSDKGCDVLIKSVAILKAQFSVKVKVTIVGEGPEKNKLVELASTDEILHQVDFIGEKTGKELAAEFKKHKVLVVPSVWEEPFGLVAIEGLASGCQVVVSRAGGLPEAVDKFGIIVEKDDPAQLASTLNSIFQNEIGPLHSKRDLQEFLNGFSISSTTAALEAEICL